MSQQSAQAIPSRESRRIRGLSPSPVLSPNPGHIPVSSANSSPLPIHVEPPTNPTNISLPASLSTPVHAQEDIITPDTINDENFSHDRYINNPPPLSPQSNATHISMGSLQHHPSHPAPMIPTVPVTTVPYWGISVSEASSSQMNSALYPANNHHPYLQLNPHLSPSPHISSNHSSHSTISSNSLRLHGPSRIHPSTPTPPPWPQHHHLQSQQHHTRTQKQTLFCSATTPRL